MLGEFLTQPLWAELLGAALLAWLLLQLIRARSAGGAWRPVPAALPLALWAFFPLLQVVPLPPVMVHWLSPRAWEIYWQSIWVVQPQAWMPLSLSPLSTLEAFFRGASAWGLYLLAVQRLAGRQRLEKVVLLLAGVAVFFAFLGLLSPALPTIVHFCAVLLPVVLALYLANRPTVVYETPRERLARWLSRPQLDRQMLLLAASVLLLVALLTIMPPAQGSWSIGLLIFSLMLLTRRRLRRWGGMLVLLATILLLATMLPPYGSNPFPSATAWQSARQILADFPMLGVGSGALSPLVSSNRTAHGDALRDSLFAGGIGIGWGGLLLVIWALVAWLRSTLAHWRRRRNTLAVCLYAGCIGGLLVALLHAAVPLLLLALLAALATAAALHSSHSLSGAASTGKPQAGMAMVLLMVLLLAGQLALPWVLLPEGLPAAFRPYSLMLFSLERQQVLLDERLQQGDLPGALQHTATALRLRPLNVSLQLQAAEILDRMGDEEAADRLWLSAAAVTPDGSRRFAQRLWQRGSSEAAKNYLRFTLAQNPQRAGEFLPLLEFWGVGHKEMSTLLPDEPLAQLALGEFLAARAENTLAVARFRRAVLLASDAGGGEPDIFERAGEYFLAQGLHPEALEMVQTGLQHFPSRIPLRRLAGGLYEKLGIHYRAIEEYRQCLVIDPTNQWARQRLAVLNAE